MKKIGLVIFAAALILGISVSSLFSLGRVDRKFFNISFNKKTRGSGKTESESRKVDGFKGVDVGGIFQVEIVAQKDFGVVVEADDNLLCLIKTEVRDGVLHIESERRISSENPLKVRISAPEIDSVDVSGVSKVTLSGVRNRELHVITSGASKVNLSGETELFTVEGSGVGAIDAGGLRAVNATVNASGATSITVFASGELHSDASGASKIFYSGNPRSIDKSTSGVAAIREK